MKTTPVTANAYQLTRLGFVNCYLVREPDGLSLIDTGLPGSADDLLAGAGKFGAAIRRILLTHAHMDHVGSVDALIGKLGSANVELVASARSVPLLQKPPNLSLEPNEPQGTIKGSTHGIKSRPTLLLTEGGLIGSLRAIETPGHMPGHLSFLDERDGTVYAGDALIGKGRLSISGFAPWFFPCLTLELGTKPLLWPAHKNSSLTLSSVSLAATASFSLAADPPSTQPSPKQVHDEADRPH
jgi:glyoxylase-like metal-dependent hydrolase (beta-lactamase superfamily II)